MGRTPKEIPDAEFAVIDLLWKDGRATVRGLRDQLYPGGTVAHYATVQKLLDRLEDKLLVRQDRLAWPHEYEPLVDREQVIGRSLQNIADKLCKGSLNRLAACLVSRNFDQSQLRSLRKLINDVTAKKQQPQS